jgi:hypothetical protein
MVISAIRKSILIILACLFFSVRVGAQDQSTASNISAKDQSIDIIDSIVEDSSRVAIVEYRCICANHLMIVPSIRIRGQVAREPDAVLRLRHALADDPRFTVHSDEDGVIRIVESGVPQDVLAVRIRQLILTQMQQYNPGLAISAVLDSPEVRAYFKKKKISVPIDIGGLVALPNDNLPKLNEKMENLAVLDEIKLILHKFPSLAVYRECIDHSGHRVVAIEFVD